MMRRFLELQLQAGLISRESAQTLTAIITKMVHEQ